MALAWALRDVRISTVLVGASRISQLQNSLGALDNLEFGEGELAEIDLHAVDGGLNLWAASSEASVI
jgi:L-glyceraldehyde 3-phosphate reductase